MLSGRVIPFSLPLVPPCSAVEQANVVVQIGRDEELLQLRAKVMSSAGLTVTSMTPDQAPGNSKESKVQEYGSSATRLSFMNWHYWLLPFVMSALRTRCFA